MTVRDSAVAQSEHADVNESRLFAIRYSVGNAEKACKSTVIVIQLPLVRDRS